MRESNTRSRTIRQPPRINFQHFPPETEVLLRRAATAAFAAGKQQPVPDASFFPCPPRGREAAEITFVMVSDREIKKLNRSYRKVNRITDIISFLNSPEPFQGDIFIARERSRRQAAGQGHPWTHELAYLVIHGVLHLYGYTDYTPVERAKMFGVQDKVFARLKAVLKP